MLLFPKPPPLKTKAPVPSPCVGGPCPALHEGCQMPARWQSEELFVPAYASLVLLHTGGHSLPAVPAYYLHYEWLNPDPEAGSLHNGPLLQ